jgi:hypothetical protein
MRLFDHSIFAPGKVLWDNFDDIDPDVRLVDQESLIGCEDVTAVRFPNGVLLDIGFYARLTPEAVFVVAVVPPSDEWNPAVERECYTAEDLQAAVAELVPVARDWKM